MDDASFRKILDRFDLSRDGYRRVRKGVKKRIVRHMTSLGLHGVDDYLRLLESDPGEVQAARQLLTVSISRFFRDRRLWDTLRDTVFPDLAVSSPRGPRAWCAGCARGEEVYSLKIAWTETVGPVPGAPPIEIWATDLNPLVLDHAREGRYGRSSLKELGPVMVARYFARVEDQYRVTGFLREQIHWACGDILTDEPPVCSPDLVFLRNSVFTYHPPDKVLEVFQRVVDNLRWGGYLVVGNNETIPTTSGSLRRIPEYRGIWKKVERDLETPEERVGCPLSRVTT